MKHSIRTTRGDFRAGGRLRWQNEKQMGEGVREQTKQRDEIEGGILPFDPNLANPLNGGVLINRMFEIG